MQLFNQKYSKNIYYLQMFSILIYFKIWFIPDGKAFSIH